MRRIIFAISFILFAAFPRAYAGWWIFGQGSNEVKINYLYICGASLEEAGPRVKIPRSSLKDGQALIKGRASVRRGSIGAVQVSLTDPADWQKAKLSADGTFEYSFAPETDKVYKFSVKALDTSGKTNEVADTERDIQFTDVDVRAEIMKALDALIEAYQAENPAAFMAHVSPDFAGDAAILDTAVRKDFSAFSEIRLAYTLSGLASGQGGKTAATINFRHQVIWAKDGKLQSTSGTTEFVFEQGEKGYRVYSMKNPLIFGLSLAEEVGTGTTTGPQGPGGGGITVTDPILAYSKTLLDGQSFDFADGTTVAGPGGDIAYAATIPAPPPPNPGSLLFKPGTKSAQLGVINVETTTSAPDKSAYSSAPAGPLIPDGGYALYLTTGKYVVLQITAINAPASITIKYKYQPDGTGQF